MNRLKKFLEDFPTQGGTVFVALTLIFAAGIVVSVRLALGEPFPDGYEPWLVFLGSLSGVTVAGMVGKRATEKPEVIRAEGDVKAAVVLAAQTPGTFPVPDAGERTTDADYVAAPIDVPTRRDD